MLLVLLLAGCQSLGIAESDPESLFDVYADEHSRFLEAGGARVHARAEGEGPAVLLLHGTLDSLHAWNGWAERLRSTHRVIRVDIPPFGLSEPLPARDYGPEHIVPLLDAVLDAFGVGSAIVAGNSLGGYYAAYYAAHAPDRVDALALISPAAYPQPLPFVLRFAATPVLGKLFEHLTPRLVVRWTLRSLYGDPDRVQESTVQRRFQLMRAPSNRRNARDVMRQIAQRAGEEPAWIRRIEQPVLLIWGEEDRWVPPELAQRWIEDLPHAQLVVFPQVGHLAMEEIPAASAAEFRRFLRLLGSDHRN